MKFNIMWVFLILGIYAVMTYDSPAQSSTGPAGSSGPDYRVINQVKKILLNEKSKYDLKLKELQVEISKIKKDVAVLKNK